MPLETKENYLLFVGLCGIHRFVAFETVAFSRLHFGFALDTHGPDSQTEALQQPQFVGRPLHLLGFTGHSAALSLGLKQLQLLACCLLSGDKGIYLSGNRMREALRE